MSEQFYVSTTLLSITLFILCVIVQNKFPDLFKESENEKALINIEVDLSEPIQSTSLLIGIIVVFFLPYLNWIISILYGAYVVYTGYTNKSGR